MLHVFRRAAVSSVAVFFLAQAIGAWADEAAAWATGSALRQRLAEPVNLLWAEKPLRQAVASLSRARHVAVLIDRRADPGQKVNLALKGESLESALQAVARRCRLDAVRLGDVVYLGPRESAERLYAVATRWSASLRRLPPAKRALWFRREKMTWEDLASPRDLLVELCHKGDAALANAERMPHDLWAAADLPPLTLADRLTLIAIQFDLTFRATDEGRLIELVSVPKDSPRIAVGDSLGAGTSSKKPGNAAKKTQKSPGATKKEAVGDELDRLRIERFVVQEKPLRVALDQLASRLGLEVRIDQKAVETAGISLDQRVSAQVENATVDELFRVLLRSTRLTFQRRSRVVEITPEPR